MGSRLSAPGPQEKRFAAYMQGLADAAGHADRRIPLKNYCTGLLLPGDRKSVEPMAARLAPNDVRRMHQSLQHVVADAPWSDQKVLEQVRQQALPAMQKHGPVVAWIIDDTGFPKQGKHSVGVARQYCGQLGKAAHCQAALSLSVSTWHASLPVGWRLYLPETWRQDAERRQQAACRKGWRFKASPRLLGAESASNGAADSCGRDTGRCRLWKGYAVPHRPQRTRTAIYSRHRVQRQSGSLDNSPGRPQSGNQAAERLPNFYAAPQTSNRFRGGH